MAILPPEKPEINPPDETRHYAALLGVCIIARSTGIGSGIFIDGKLYRSRTGSAGEVFRMNIKWQRWGEELPNTGYFEN